MHLLVDVWREACRHGEISLTAERIGQLLAGHLPADLLLLRRVDLAQRRIETIACGVVGRTTVPSHARTEIRPEQVRALRAWFDGGRVRHGAVAVSDPVLAAVTPPELRGPVMAGPLMTNGQPLGVALFAVGGAARARFTEAHDELAQSLLEPFAVVLANDARLHELTHLRNALEADKRALLDRLARQDVTEAIVGAEAGLRLVMERVTQVAATDAPVLIFGETGTGKEVVARAIHVQSRRARGPVVRVNCGALPPGLIDSELFGHERGSFTGALNARQGCFERADGGTLFLDEIGELPLDAQVRLLRILQDGTFERVGGHRTLTVDVRVVAATHRDLQAMVGAGTFREDLWYRLSVFPIRLPALRERVLDIPALATHFAERAGKRLGGMPLILSAEDIALLTAYRWPGNVRELAAVIERAAILGDGHRLEIAAALGGVHPAGGETHRQAPDAIVPAAAPVAELDLNTVMARHIERVLELSSGRIEGGCGAAAMLGVNPHTLRARMRKLGIDWGRFRAPAARGTSAHRPAVAFR
jgi:hydrogenase-4 transcriptional activator